MEDATDVSIVLGIALIGVGAASAVYGAILCYTTKVSIHSVEKQEIHSHRKKIVKSTLLQPFLVFKKGCFHETFV